MSQNSAPRHSVSGLFVFLLLGMFAVFSTVMVLLGARAYRNIASAQEQHNNDRIAPAYLRSMIRATDERDAYLIESLGNGDVLTIRQDYDGEQVDTYIYCYDGYLREYVITLDPDLEFEPENGETICPMDRIFFEIESKSSLMHVRLDQGGETTDVLIYMNATCSE